MDEATLLAALRRHWEYEATDKDISHEIYHDDAVLEFPQSQERFEGKANFIVWRKMYSAALEFKIRRIRGRGDFWVAQSHKFENEKQRIASGDGEDVTPTLIHVPDRCVTG